MTIFLFPTFIISLSFFKKTAIFHWGIDTFRILSKARDLFSVPKGASTKTTRVVLTIVAPVFGKLIGAKTLDQISSRQSIFPNVDKPAVTTVPMRTQAPVKTKAVTPK